MIFPPNDDQLLMSHSQSPVAISLLTELLKLDWRKRVNAIDALKHPYFSTPPLPARPGDLPSFEDSHELDRRRFRGQRAAMPPAPAGGSVGMGQSGGGWSTNSGNRMRAESRNSRIPGVARRVKPNVNGARGAQRLDPWNHEPLQTRQRRSNEDMNRCLPPRHRDGGLPPKPPAPAHHSWTVGHPEMGVKDRKHAGRHGGPEANADSYIPSYGGSDRNRGRDFESSNATWRTSHRDRSFPGSNLDYPRDNASRRSRSPLHRERLDRSSYRR